MLVVNGKAGDTLQLVGSGSWNTVTTGLRGADLNNPFGADYNFMPADLYIQLRNNGVTLFIFVAPRT